MPRPRAVLSSEVPLYNCSTIQVFLILSWSIPSLYKGSVYSNPEVPACRKNTGKNRSLRKWSRGHQFIVRGGGHIDTWQSLFRYVHHRKVTVNFNTCHLSCHLSCSPPVHYRSCCTLDHSVFMIHAAQVQIRGALDAVAKYVDPLSSDMLQCCLH